MNRYAQMNGNVIEGLFTTPANVTHRTDIIKAEAEWEVGGTVSNGIYTAPAATPPTAEEVRAERDALLEASDVNMLRLLENSDDATEMKAYRQALRDITSQEGFPENVTWPTKP